MENLAQDERVFRSLIKKYFPVELLIRLDGLTESYDVDNNTKTKYITNLLQEYKVPYTPLGNGTNRYGILIDGYAVKLALDRAGKIDNKREFKYAKKLYPDVVKVYECLETGLVAVTEYLTIFSLDDFYDNQSKMREILKRISSFYLVGDIGVTTENYVNWGTRLDGSIAILDFAYIYALSYKAFKCSCVDEGTLEFDNDYVNLVCPFCKKKYTFSDIRKRVSREDERLEIGDIMKLGYVLEKDEEKKVIDYNISPKPPGKKKKKKPQRPVRPKVVEEDNEDKLSMLESLNKYLYKQEDTKNGQEEKETKKRRTESGRTD